MPDLVIIPSRSVRTKMAHANAGLVHCFVGIRDSRRMAHADMDAAVCAG
jgi:hypothetical protein